MDNIINVRRQFLQQLNAAGLEWQLAIERMRIVYSQSYIGALCKYGFILYQGNEFLRGPGLAIIQVGDNAASVSYVKKKMAMCARNNIHHELHHFKEETDKLEIISAISQLNMDPRIDGILVQLPLPKHLSRLEISNTISVDKDVDCLNTANFQSLIQNGEQNDIIPCTPAAVLHILDTFDIDVRKMSTTVIGRSQLVGFPLAICLLKRNAKVTICHAKTTVQEHVQNADLVIACAGASHMVKKHWIKEGAKVIDVGINRIGHQLIGDVEYAPQASFFSPVPGGVGPLTVAMLMKNLYKLWCRNNGLEVHLTEMEHYAQNYEF